VTQLGLWEGRYPWTPPLDLIAKIRAEASAGVEVRYYFSPAGS
jgi:hypothetical protein